MNSVQLRGHGPNGETFSQVDSTHKSLRVSVRPWEHDAGGHYRIAARSGALTGAAIVAGAPLFSFQWNPTGGFIATLLRLRAFYIPTVVFTAQQELGLDLMHVTGFSTGDTAVGTVVQPQKVRQSMLNSQVTDCRIAAATLLTAGVRVLDPTALEVGGGLVNVVNAAAATAYVNPNPGNNTPFGFDYDPLLRGEMPLTMGKGEGFLVRNTVVFPAAGVATLVVIASVVEYPAQNQLIITSG